MAGLGSFDINGRRPAPGAPPPLPLPSVGGGASGGGMTQIAGPSIPWGNFGGGGAGGDDNATTVQPLNFSAEKSPELLALLGESQSYINDLKNNTGHTMDELGAKLRDSREGGKRSLQQGESARGVNSSMAQSNYEGATQRGVQDTLAGVARDREAMRGGAIQGAAGIAGGINSAAMAEKALQLGAWSAQQQAQAAKEAANYNQWLSLLGEYRSSPAYGY